MGGSRKADERCDTQELPPGVSPATVRNASRLPMFMQGWATRNHRRRHPLAVIVICIALVLNWAVHIAIGYYDGELLAAPHPALPVVLVVGLIALLALSLAMGFRASRNELRKTQDLLTARQRYLVVFAGSFSGVCAASFYALLFAGEDFSDLARLPLMGLLITGLGLLVAAFSAARRGRELRCAGCGYAFDIGLGKVCPECGRDWLGEGSLVRGGRRRGWARPAVLFAILVLPAVFMILALDGAGPYRYMPTSQLVRLAESQSGRFGNPWRELGERELTDGEVRRLVEGLVNTPWERRFPDGSRAGWWLKDQMRLRRIPDDVLQQIIADMVEIELLTPADARVGEEVEVRVVMRTLADRWPPFLLHAVFGGYTIDGGFAPLERGDRMRVVQAPARGVPRERPLADSVVFTPDQSGEVRVSIDCWFFLDPPLPAGAISWRLDGTPDPAYAVFGSLHMRQTATIRVLSAEEP